MAQHFSRLLLATQHTEFDAGAEALAMQMAQRCGLPLATVIPLVSNPEFEAFAPELAQRAEQLAATHIAALRAQAQQMGVTIDLRVRRGEEPYLEIVDEARARGTELIVVRRRGKTGFLANLLMGEMVSKVLAHAPCPVMFAPRCAVMWQRAVLVAAQPDAPGLHLVELATTIAAECGLPLHLVHVALGAQDAVPGLDAFLAQAQALVRAQGVALNVLCRQGRPHTEILAALQACGADLLVIGGRSGATPSHAVVGSVTQKVIGLVGDLPVLAVNPSTSGQGI